MPGIIYPSSASGTWEAALVNILSPCDRVLMYETGHFASQWQRIALKLRLDVDFIPSDWRWGVEAEKIEHKLSEDSQHIVKAVVVVHNETSTGAVSNIAAIRNAIDQAAHPALFLVDAVSSLGSMEFQHDDWGVDVTVCGSQKGLMMPPGLGFNALSENALAAGQNSGYQQSYWTWETIVTISVLMNCAKPYLIDLTCLSERVWVKSKRRYSESAISVILTTSC